jgi:hypothetical protein
MYTQQMLAFVTPHFRRRRAENPLIGERLKQAFERIGAVHFASLTLLPGRTGGGGEPALPVQLMLELAVDDGLSVAQTINMLVNHALPTLTALLCPSGRGTRAQRLRRLLQRCVRQADGGYVGARDRGVAQIRAEAELFIAARRQLASIAPARPRADRAALAREVVDWVASQPRFQPLTQPAPRSFWRSPRPFPLQLVLALVRLGWPLLVAAGALGLTGLLAGRLMQSLPPAALGWFGPATVGALGVLHFGAVLALCTLARGLGPLLLAAGLLLGVLLVAGLAAVGLAAAWGLATWSGPAWWTGCHVGHPLLFGGAVAAQLAALAVAVGLGVFVSRLRGSPFVLAFIGLGLLGIDLLASLGLGMAANRALGLPWRPFAGPGLALAGASVVQVLAFAALLAGAAWLFRLAARRLLRQLRAADRPDPRAAAPGHTVAASIEVNEAALARGTNHMLSLTDVRPGRAWLLRFWLRFISRLGHMLFTEGRLGHAEGVKYGRWHVLDGGRRLVFVAAFDGSFGGYLDEFILGGSQGANLFWRWTELRRRPPAAPGQPGVTLARVFPPTRYWAFGGCRNEQAFKNYARSSMLPHLWVYQAYDHSNLDIARATRLRDALCGARSPAKDDAVLRALES